MKPHIKKLKKVIDDLMGHEVKIVTEDGEEIEGVLIELTEKGKKEIKKELGLMFPSASLSGFWIYKGDGKVSFIDYDHVSTLDLIM